MFETLWVVIIVNSLGDLDTVFLASKYSNVLIIESKRAWNRQIVSDEGDFNEYIHILKDVYRVESRFALHIKFPASSSIAGLSYAFDPDVLDRTKSAARESALKMIASVMSGGPAMVKA